MFCYRQYSYFTINGIAPSKQITFSITSSSLPLLDTDNSIHSTTQGPLLGMKLAAKDLSLFITEIQIITLYLSDNCTSFHLNAFCYIIVLSITRQGVDRLRYYELYYPR